MRSIVDPSYIVNNQSWVVSLVCKKGEEHGFLLLQGEIDREAKFWRSDLFLDGDQPLRQMMEVPAVKYAASLFKEEKVAAMEKMHFDGNALIQLVEKDEEYFQELQEVLKHYSWRITAAQGNQLHKNIQADIGKNIRYFVFGGGSSWSSVLSQCGNYHNCMSWAQKKLQDIGIDDVPKSSKDFIAVLPSAVMASGKPKGMCIVC